jgi:hypothetical protein
MLCGGRENVATEEDVDPSLSDRAGAGDWRIVEKAGECGTGVEARDSRCVGMWAPATEEEFSLSLSREVVWLCEWDCAMAASWQ